MIKTSWWNDRFPEIDAYVEGFDNFIIDTWNEINNLFKVKLKVVLFNSPKTKNF